MGLPPGWIVEEVYSDVAKTPIPSSNLGIAGWREPETNAGPFQMQKFKHYQR